MNSKKENIGVNSSKKIIISVILISFLVVFVIGISFATFINTQEGTKENMINTGSISMTYTEDTNGIKIENALPINDEVGKALSGENEYFDFTVSTKIKGTANVIYEVAAIKDESSTLNDNDIKLYLEQQVSGTYKEVFAPGKYTPIDVATEIGSPVGSMVLAQVSHNGDSVDNYRLRMWVAEEATVELESKMYMVKVNVYGKTK